MEESKEGVKAHKLVYDIKGRRLIHARDYVIVAKILKNKTLL